MSKEIIVWTSVHTLSSRLKPCDRNRTKARIQAIENAANLLDWSQLPPMQLQGDLDAPIRDAGTGRPGGRGSAVGPAVRAAPAAGSESCRCAGSGGRGRPDLRHFRKPTDAGGPLRVPEAPRPRRQG